MILSITTEKILLVPLYLSYPSCHLYYRLEGRLGPRVLGDTKVVIKALNNPSMLLGWDFQVIMTDTLSNVLI